MFLAEPKLAFQPDLCCISANRKENPGTDMMFCIPAGILIIL
jgi:hypothetical protein